jgi:septation ring formation regulator EzrA
MKVHFISLILAIHVLEVFFSLIGVKGIMHKNIEAKVDNLEVRKNYLTPILK